MLGCNIFLRCHEYGNICFIVFHSFSYIHTYIHMLLLCFYFIRYCKYAGIITIEEPHSMLVSLALFISTYTRGLCNVVFALLCVVRIHLIQRCMPSSTSSIPSESSTQQVQGDNGKSCAALVFF